MSASIGLSMFWVAAIACAVAQAAILRAVVGGTRTEGPTTSVAEPRGRRRSSAGAEVIWAIVPGIVLVLLFAATWRAMHLDRQSRVPASQGLVTPAPASR
jgi:hypothetical protein